MFCPRAAVSNWKETHLLAARIQLVVLPAEVGQQVSEACHLALHLRRGAPRVRRRRGGASLNNVTEQSA